jgi:membrane fusion protein, heavy metal efflux system
MFATVTFGGAAEQALVVPSSALLQARGTSYVFVETEPFRFETRPVVAGQTMGERIVIESGLEADERIVTRAAPLLQ